MFNLFHRIYIFDNVLDLFQTEGDLFIQNKDFFNSIYTFKFNLNLLIHHNVNGTIWCSFVYTILESRIKNHNDIILQQTGK